MMRTKRTMLILLRQSNRMGQRLCFSGAVKARVVGVVWPTLQAGQAGDAFDFAQGRFFAPPEKRLRSGWPPQVWEAQYRARLRVVRPAKGSAAADGEAGAGC